jgi:enterochelin esterase-like enzyme
MAAWRHARAALWLAATLALAAHPAGAAIDGGTFERDFLDSARRLRDALLRNGVEVRHVEVHQGHSWGHWRELLDDLLVFFYGRS